MRNPVAVSIVVVALALGTPVVIPSIDTAAAQNTRCSCYATFDGVDSDLKYVDRYYNTTAIDVPANECGEACDAWRREWFYWNACDFPMRINRGRNAWWGYVAGGFDTHEGPETWWCPFPPP